MKASLEPWPVHLSKPDGAKPAIAPVGMLPGSLAAIYDEHFDFIWRNARRLGVPDAQADDVVQDVFIVVQRRIKDFDGRVPLRAWVFGILVRVVRDYRRSFRRKGSRCVPLEEAAGSHGMSAAASDPNPGELAERSERIRLLDTLLDRLDEGKRTVLVLSELEQWTLREIAEFMGSNINTVHSRLRAAKRDFERLHAEWLAEKGVEP